MVAETPPATDPASPLRRPKQRPVAAAGAPRRGGRSAPLAGSAAALPARTGAAMAVPHVGPGGSTERSPRQARAIAGRDIELGSAPAGPDGTGGAAGTERARRGPGGTLGVQWDGTSAAMVGLSALHVGDVVPPHPSQCCRVNSPNVNTGTGRGRRGRCHGETSVCVSPTPVSWGKKDQRVMGIPWRQRGPRWCHKESSAPAGITGSSRGSGNGSVPIGITGPAVGQRDPREAGGTVRGQRGPQGDDKRPKRQRGSPRGKRRSRRGSGDSCAPGGITGPLWCTGEEAQGTL